MDFEKLFQQFKDVKVGVIGDVMLDTYWWGHVERISPEAPVPIVSLDKRELRIGGAGNVALNLVSMGAQVSVFSVIGKDADGELLSDLFSQNNINTSYLLRDTERKTTNKTRIMSRNQQMMRLDSETTEDIPSDTADGLLNNLQQYIINEKPAVIILEDYNKGVLTEKLITDVVALCRQHDVITAVDPKKKNFFAYKNVHIFKPNLKEVKEGLNISIDKVNLESMQKVHNALCEKLNHEISFITLSEKGVFYQNSEKGAIIPSHIRNIADVSGAGDTVIAVASLLYAVTKDQHLMAEVANIAGGLVCEEVGTQAIDRHRLLIECKLLLN
jgi:rfaE bifunctional protein kinase chain/domain